MLKKVGPFSIIWVLITSLLLIFLKVQNPTFVESLRLKGFDMLLSSDEQQSSDQIVIVDIGERSIERFGQWPWDRRDLAKIISRIAELDAAMVVVPVIMSERDRMGGDGELAEQLNNIPSVIVQAPTNQNSRPDAVRRGVSVMGGDPDAFLFTWPGALAPRPELAQSASGVGTSAVAPEIDGVVRRLPLIVNIGNNYYPNVTLEAIRVLMDEQSYQVRMNESGVEKIRIPNVPIIDTDSNARIWLRWSNTFTRYEAVDVLDNNIDLGNRIVVLGLGVEGLGGIIATPRGEMWAHDLQAVALQTVIDGSSPSRPWWSEVAEIVSIAFITLIVMLLMPRLPIWAMAVLLLATVGGIITTGLYFWVHNSFLLDIYFVTVAAILLYGHGLFARFVKEFLQKQQIKKQFGTYLSPAMVEKLQKDPDLLKLGGETRELSIMFTDVRGFTTISEHYGSNVQGLTKIMNRYMTAMTAKILENNGTIDKYIGDAQMAFWNAPLDDKDHAINAVKTAFEMFKDLERFNNEIAAEGIPPFRMGLGINTGSVVVGNMGSDQRFDYTCLGDSVNLAARLEGQSKPYGVRLVIGQNTNELVKDTFFTVELDYLAVKGKKEGVRIYTVIEEKESTLRSKLFTERELHNKMLNYYRSRSWDQAIIMCKTLTSSFDSQLKDYYQMWIERCQELKEHDPGPQWDTVYRATSK